MKMRFGLLICAVLVLILVGFLAIQIPTKREYDELRDHFVGYNVATEEMTPTDEARIDQVREHWKKVQSESVVSATTDLLAELDFTPDSAGLAAIHSHQAPPYSFVDPASNRRNSAILTFLNLSAFPPGTRIAVGDGEAFIEYKRIAEHYQDVDGGILRDLYFNEINEAEQGVAPQSATRSESDSEGGHKPQSESEARSQ